MYDAPACRGRSSPSHGVPSCARPWPSEPGGARGDSCELSHFVCDAAQRLSSELLRATFHEILPCRWTASAVGDAGGSKLQGFAHCWGGAFLFPQKTLRVSPAYSKEHARDRDE